MKRETGGRRKKNWMTRRGMQELKRERERKGGRNGSKTKGRRTEKGRYRETNI